VLATNTSYLDGDAIAAATTRPQDVLGLHFFSPANVMKLLEVVRGTQTSPLTCWRRAWCSASNCEKHRCCAVTPSASSATASTTPTASSASSLEDGAWPEDVDQALEAFGFAMGPFSVADLSEAEKLSLPG